MNIGNKRRGKLTVTVLSLSLLTVMAGAAVAPALNVIKLHFADSSQILIQMIISTPSIFIVLTNIFFPKLSRLFKIRDLALAGLLLYLAGGCMAGLFDNIYIVLIFRALVGVGVGIIMPMSTGLISFYYTRDKQDKLMGYSSAMNQLGGVVATLASGLLASFSWRASFLVYLMGLFSIILCIRYLPEEKLVHGSESGAAAAADGKKGSGTFRTYYMFIIAIFISMLIFFVYPSAFAIETAKENIISHNCVTIIMTGLDVVAIFGGLSFVHIKKKIGINTRFIGPVFFLLGYVLLLVPGGWTGAIIGSALIGYANGVEIPFIISSASQRAGRMAASTVIPLLSMSMYLAQFVTPVILSAITKIFQTPGDFHLSYLTAALCSGLLIVWSLTIHDAKGKDIVHQEN